MGRAVSWQSYVVRDYFETEAYFSGFPAGSFVLDVGCGVAFELSKLIARGCTGVGTEVDDSEIAVAKAEGRPVVKAEAEALPFRTGSVDGIVFKGVLPYTNEHRAFAELARVLRPGGRMEALYLGVGYPARSLLRERYRVYAGRSLVNTIAMRLTRRPLPESLADTVYASPGRLAEHYRRYGFRLLRHTPSPTFLGLPVFIYHSVERVDGAASGAAAQGS